MHQWRQFNTCNHNVSNVLENYTKKGSKFIFVFFLHPFSSSFLIFHFSSLNENKIDDEWKNILWKSWKNISRLIITWSAKSCFKVMVLGWLKVFLLEKDSKRSWGWNKRFHSVDDYEKCFRGLQNSFRRTYKIINNIWVLLKIAKTFNFHSNWNFLTFEIENFKLFI